MSTARVDFTRGAAERIAAVVRRVEQGDRDGTPLTFGKAMDQLPGTKLKLGTFTGNWNLNELKIVTFCGVTATPNMAFVRNLCTPSLGFSTSNTSESRYVIFGKVKYTTELVVVEIQQSGTATCTMTLGNVNLTSLAGYSSGQIQLLGHNESACLQWYSITTCATATSSP